jgi:hypothetical protein
MQYVGYELNATIQCKGYENRNSANRLSLLMSKVCEFQWPVRYSLKFYVICLFTDKPMGQLCEVVLSRYLHAYTVNGGLDIDWAGKSTSNLALPVEIDAERQVFWIRKQ